MAANSRFDLSSSSPDGLNFCNGQRAPYGATTLEKSGTFREGLDRIFSSASGTSKANGISSQGEMTSLVQSLALDLKGVVADQKSSRPGEIKRAVSSILGVPEDLSSTIITKPLPPMSMEEIKRLKSNLQEGSIKARDRVKTFSDASFKIERFYGFTRKRSRVDSLGERSTSLFQGGSVLKTGPQNHFSGTGIEIGCQRLEEKAKIGVPNRRIRTSLVEMDAQGSGVARTTGPLERDKDMFKPINSSAVQVEENDRVFSNVADGWERSKMKKKRSVIKSDASTSSGLIKSQGVDRETKRGVQQKLGIDARPRAYYANTFRPGSDSSATVIGKSDLSTQQTSLNMRSRSEQNISSISNDRREARFCPDVENGSLRVINKSNNREDNCAATPTLLKFGSARPRSNSTSISKTSPSINRVVGNSEDMESSQTVDKFNAVGAMNRKRSTSLRSSSPPVGQWAVQRPQKISRSSRRSSLSPLVSNHDELAISETIEEGTINHDASIARRAPSTASQQNKLRGDHFAVASLSESDESGVQENKVKDKVKKCTDMEDKPGQTVQKFTNLIASSRKMAVEEDGGDIDRRQGRIGRGFASARSVGSATFEKIGDGVTTKQQRSIRHGSERVESKPGRPPIKKLTERKSNTRPRQSINILSLESSDEAADDHEELVAAATSAIDAGRICSGSFWKQVEPVFGFVSIEDLAFLHEQIQLTNDAAAIISAEAEDSQNLKVDQEHFSLSSAPTVTTRSESNVLCNGFNFYEHQRETGLTKQTLHNGPFADHFLLQSGSCTGVSICQALLSAIIGEDDVDNLYSTMDYGEDLSYNDPYATQFELDKDLKTKGVNLQRLDDVKNTGRMSESYKIGVNCRLYDEVLWEKSGANGTLETTNRHLSSFHHALKQLIPNQSVSFSTACTDFQYSQMSINDRLILELSEIGLFPEAVPDLTYGEDEDITEGIHTLEVKLHEKAANRRSLLHKLEKAVMNAREIQQRELEHLAMKRLLQIAYDRYMACLGPNASGNKNVNKFAKHAALFFVKRTLARCKKFEETGISCFNEPVFRDIFVSASSRCCNLQIADVPADDHNPIPTDQIGRRVDMHARTLNASRTVNQPQDHSFGKDYPWTNKVKKKEVSLDDVVASTSGLSRTPPGLGSSFSSGAKGKRSERDRDGKGHNKDAAFKNGNAKIGRPATSSTKVERKNKLKPKLKTTQLSASMNVLHSKTVEMSTTTSSFNPKLSELSCRDIRDKENLSLIPGSGTKKSSNDGDAIDLCNLHLPDIGDFGGQGQDIASWLNFEDEGLQDHDDCMGLEIPMDDLSEVHMMI